jgi:transporter family-2 protein
MDRTTALTASLLVGLLVAAQPPANAELGKHVGDLGAAFVSLAISLLIVSVLLLMAGDVGRLTSGLAHIRPEHALGGLAGAAVVLVSLIAVRSLGAGGVAAALVATQLIGAVILDRLGVLGLDGSPITLQRVAGVVLLLGGTVLVTSAG